MSKRSTNEELKEVENNYQLKKQTLAISKNVTKVQRLPNIDLWDEENTSIIRDEFKCSFVKKSGILKIKRFSHPRKRKIIVTQRQQLVIYETNCTGYCFDIRDARKLVTTSDWLNIGLNIEKRCIICLKYTFGNINLILYGDHITTWRNVLCTVYDCDTTFNSWHTDPSYFNTPRNSEDAENDDTSFDISSRKSEFEYTDSIVSLRSAPGCTNLSIYDVDEPSEELEKSRAFHSSSTCSNNSLLPLPSTTEEIDYSSSSYLNFNSSICVSNLRRQFEAVFGAN